MSVIKDFFLGCVQFRVLGLPHACLNKLRKFHITNIQIIDDTILFCAPLRFVKSIKKLINNFDYEIKENQNIFRGINFLLNHFVLVIAVILGTIAFFVADMSIYTVKVQCNDIELTPAIYQHLNDLGVKKYTFKNKLKKLDLASDIVQSFNNVAHVNVKVSGNTLVVNLITATNELGKVKTNYYAQYDAVITEITAYSGTALVTVGDVVKKGDLLVANAYLDSVVAMGEVAFVNGEQISRLNIWII